MGRRPIALVGLFRMEAAVAIWMGMMMMMMWEAEERSGHCCSAMIDGR